MKLLCGFSFMCDRKNFLCTRSLGVLALFVCSLFMVVNVLFCDLPCGGIQRYFFVFFYGGYVVFNPLCGALYYVVVALSWARRYSLWWLRGGQHFGFVDLKLSPSLIQAL